MSSKNVRMKIKLVSSAGTGHFYTSTKNKRYNSEKIRLKKFDPIICKHVVYNEEKLR